MQKQEEELFDLIIKTLTLWNQRGLRIKLAGYMIPNASRFIG
jgi:hypothetical protein